MAQTTLSGEGEAKVASVAVMFCDISGSTTLYRTLGDTAAERLVRSALKRMTKICNGRSGSLIKTIGDELMCRYPTGQDAAHAAIEMQREIRLPQEGYAGAEKLRLRIGFAAGSAVERDNDLFGDVVNIAARLASMAKADQILTTEAAVAEFDRDLRSSTRLFDRTPVKGIKEEIGVCQVLWDKRDQTSIIAVAPSTTTMAMKLQLGYAGQVATLTQKDVPKRMGRSEDCDIVIQSDFASRFHARIEYNRGKFMLVDESSNGTYVEVEEVGKRKSRVVYLRNESFALVGSGRFSLGTRPENDPHVLTFESL